MLLDLRGSTGSYWGLHGITQNSSEFLVTPFAEPLLVLLLVSRATAVGGCGELKSEFANLRRYVDVLKNSQEFLRIPGDA